MGDPDVNRYSTIILDEAHERTLVTEILMGLPKDAAKRATILKYRANNVLLREAISDPDVNRYSTIILDEAHERTLATDILVGLPKDAAKRATILKYMTNNALLREAMSDTDVNCQGREKFKNHLLRILCMPISLRMYSRVREKQIQMLWWTRTILMNRMNHDASVIARPIFCYARPRFLGVTLTIFAKVYVFLGPLALTQGCV